mmetsp:Transcript_11210/g.26935  ORF Transcript_11210/g.26935 Transcript_11210/m.26935 type:complete len:300 (-) Transcript_11210:202-1101(-)
MRPRLDPVSFIYVHPPNLPIGFVQSIWFTLDVFVTRFEFFGFLFAINLEPISGNAPTKGRIQDETHILEMVGTTVGSLTNGKVTIGQWPLIGIRHDPLAFGFVSRSNGLDQVFGNRRVRRKDPTSEMFVLWIPFQGKDSTALFVEGYSQRTTVRVNGHTSLIQPLMRIIDKAVAGFSKGHVGNTRLSVGNPNRCIPSPSHGSLWYIVHVTLLGSVQGCLGFSLVIDSLHNVNLSIDRPIGFVCHPKSRPETTALRHVSEINDKESPVVPAFAFEANGFTRSIGSGSRFHVQEGFFGLFF